MWPLKDTFQFCFFTLCGAHSKGENGVWLETPKGQASWETKRKILVQSGDLGQSFLQRAGAFRKERVMSREKDQKLRKSGFRKEERRKSTLQERRSSMEQPKEGTVYYEYKKLFYREHKV